MRTRLGIYYGRVSLETTETRGGGSRSDFKGAHGYLVNKAKIGLNHDVQASRPRKEAMKTFRPLASWACKHIERLQTCDQTIRLSVQLEASDLSISTYSSLAWSPLGSVPYQSSYLISVPRFAGINSLSVSLHFEPVQCCRRRVLSGSDALRKRRKHESERRESVVEAESVGGRRLGSCENRRQSRWHLPVSTSSNWKRAWREERRRRKAQWEVGGMLLKETRNIGYLARSTVGTSTVISESLTRKDYDNLMEEKWVFLHNRLLSLVEWSVVISRIRKQRERGIRCCVGGQLHSDTSTTLSNIAILVLKCRDFSRLELFFFFWRKRRDMKKNSLLLRKC